MRIHALLGSMLTTFALATLLGGCADSGESGGARLDRLEARIDRLDDRLTRTEGRLPTAEGASARERESANDTGSDTEPNRDLMESFLGDMDPERRARLRRQFRGFRRRMEQLEEGADLTANPGTPEFRRGLLLEMLRPNRRGGSYRGRRGTEDDAWSAREDGADEEQDGDTSSE